MKRLSIIVTVLVAGVLFMGICAAQDAEKQRIAPKKVEADTNYDGKIDRIEYYDENGKVTKVQVDTKGTGNFDETILYKDGKPVKSEKDTNGDGKPDVWIDY